jgi:hypothetical protein
MIEIKIEIIFQTQMKFESMNSNEIEISGVKNV